MNTDKQNFQQWLSGNSNITHAIHMKPNDYSETLMRKYLSWVNYELNKTFLSRRFYNFKNQFDSDLPPITIPMCKLEFVFN